jgi:hypothetical protein
MLELYAATLVDSSAGWVVLTYRGATLVAGVGLPLLAGAVGAMRTGRIQTGAAVGFWSGLISGLITFLTLMLMTYLFMAAFQADPQNVHDFHQSGERTLATLIVGDSLFASCAHLVVIGMLWGTVLGVVGAAVGLALATVRQRA